MRRISFTICSDAAGKMTVTNTIKYIMENVKEIYVPNVNITTIPLATLSLAEDKTKRCIDGYADGKKWIDGKCVEYEITLIFE